MKRKFILNFYTQNKQFYICDKNYEDHSEPLWNEESAKERLALKNGIVGVVIECEGPVKGEFYLINVPSISTNFQEYDHVVEGTLVVSSGIVQLQDSPNKSVELQFMVEPGSYRIRIYSSNLSSVKDDEGDDFYKIEMWPSNEIGKKVLKRYK